MSDNDQGNQAKGFTAPNVKTNWLKEVEEDATYIANKRFQEHYDEQAREKEKAERLDSKQSASTDKKG